MSIGSLYRLRQEMLLQCCGLHARVHMQGCLPQPSQVYMLERKIHGHVLW